MDTPRLHPDTIEAVKQRADIVDVVAEYVVLKKRGKDFVGLCPFHDDKSPSFTVSSAKQFYYCFSCGAGGNTVKFLMELGKQSFTDVVLDLARRYQVPVQTLEPRQRQELQRQISLREQLFEILAATARFYEHALRQPQGSQALDYLKVQRQLREETIQQFQLGYAPAGWSTLYGYLVEQKRYPADLIERTGLIVRRKNSVGFYDRFRDRLIIPIHDLQGRVIGFGGRTLSGEEPKYLNSPETELFDKGKTLFGLDKAKGAIAKRDQALVVEGYFDVIALHAAGITHAVAALGTALSAGQVKQLLRYSESKQIILNFDADRAGTQAAERAIGEVEDLAYQGQVQLRVLNLPGGKDADEYLQSHTPADYEELLARAPLWLDWQIQQLVEHRDLRQADQFQASVHALVHLLGKLPHTALRTHYIHRCAELLSQGEARVTLQLEADLRAQVRGQRWHGQSRRWEKPGDYSARELAEALMLRIYLHCPTYRPLLRQTLRERDLENFSIQHHRLLWSHICAIEEAHLGLEGMLAIDQGSGCSEMLSEIELLDLVQDQLSEWPQETTRRLTPLFYLDEKSRLDLYRPSLDIRGAAATLERIRCEKRCRHLLESWQYQSLHSVERCIEKLLAEGADTDLDGETQIEQLHQELNAEALYFQKLYYEEKQYLQALDGQRCATPEDLIEAPTYEPEIA